MSINAANALLWQKDTLSPTAFSGFKRYVLKELSAQHGLIVDQTGENGKSVKPDYINALFNVRAWIETERYIPASVNIKIYRAPKDWKHVLEEEVILEPNGDLCLNKATRPADYPGECRVIDPRNYAPFFAYRPGYILAGDLKDLLEDDYLRVVYLKARKSLNQENS